MCSVQKYMHAYSLILFYIIFDDIFPFFCVSFPSARCKRGMHTRCQGWSLRSMCGLVWESWFICQHSLTCVKLVQRRKQGCIAAPASVCACRPISDIFAQRRPFHVLLHAVSHLRLALCKSTVLGWRALAACCSHLTLDASAVIDPALPTTIVLQSLCLSMR